MIQLFLVFNLLFAQNYSEIPDGFLEGRKDLPRSVYGSHLSKKAEKFQDQILSLSQKVFGLQTGKITDPLDFSQWIPLLEADLLLLYLDISNSSLNQFEKNTMLFEVSRVYESLRFINERLYEDTIRLIDWTLPGASGLQIPVRGSKYGKKLYEPNFRIDRSLSVEERAIEYEKKLESFNRKNYPTSAIQILDGKLLKSWGSFVRVEYVYLEDGSIVVTETDAGHIILAKGQRVQAAGQMIFLKNHKAQIVFVIISNASGSYKPDLLQAQKLAQVLKRKFKLPDALFVVSKGELLSSQIFRLRLKASHTAPEQIKLLTQEFETKIEEKVGRFKMCREVISPE